jgi:glutamate racemase
MRIGFFDSGIGGLAIMKSVRAELPQYDYLFMSDTNNLPYGDKTESEVYTYTKAAVRRLFEEGALIVILACNTASAQTLRKLQDTFLLQEYPERKILGVIIPTIEEFIDRRRKNVLLIGTKRTIDSRKYELELQKVMIKSINFSSMATPQLVPLIEEDKINDAIESIRSHIDNHIGNGGDSLILGCTHYVLLKDRIRALYGDHLLVISQDEIIPDKLKKYLHVHHDLEAKLSLGGGEEILLPRWA